MVSFLEYRRFHQGGNHNFPEVSHGSTADMLMVKLNGGKFHNTAFHLVSFLENRRFHQGDNHHFPEVSHDSTADIVMVKLNGGQFHKPAFHLASFLESRFKYGNHRFLDVYKSIYWKNLQYLYLNSRDKRRVIYISSPLS